VPGNCGETISDLLEICNLPACAARTLMRTAT
jgi:hypothetical protein